VQGRRRRLLSPLDASFLYFERPTQLLHVGSVAILDASVPFEDLVAAMDARIKPFRRYRQRPVRPFLDLGWPRWEEDPDFDVRRHVRHVAVPPPGGERELHELVDTLFAVPLDRERPLWELYAIDGLADGRSALLWKIHHCMIDGVSGAQLLETMADGTPLAPRLPRPRPGPFEQARAAAEAVRAALAPAALRERMADAFEAAGTIVSMLRHPSPSPPFDGPLSDRRRIVWAAFPLDALLTVRGAAGCKVNDVVLAVIAGALRRYVLRRGALDRAPWVRALVPVSLRGAAEHLKLGNLVSAMFPVLPLDEPDPAERLRRIAAEMGSLKDRGQARASALVLGLAGVLSAPVSALLGRLMPCQTTCNTVITNVPGPREPVVLLGRRILDVHPIVPLFMGMGLEFAVMSYTNRLSICANADARLVPDAHLLPDDLRDSFAELVGACGARPDTAAAAPLPGGLRVADLMVERVIAVGPGDSVPEAYRLMRACRIRHLPVVGPAGELLGVVSHRDLVAAGPSSLLGRPEEERVRLLAWACVGDLMETHVSTASPEEPAAEAGRRLVRYKIGCLPVVDARGGLAGIVTEEDFLRWATERMAG